jgi:phage-related protein
MAVQRRPIEFRGGSPSDLRAFPAVAPRRAGYRLDRLQLGLEPDDWKSMPDIGAGVGVIYIAKFQEAIYVLTASRRPPRQARRISRWPGSATTSC